MCFSDISLFLFFQLSTLTTCNQYISLYFDVESLDTHDMRNKGISLIFLCSYSFNSWHVINTFHCTLMLKVSKITTWAIKVFLKTYFLLPITSLIMVWFWSTLYRLKALNLLCLMVVCNYILNCSFNSRHSRHVINAFNCTLMLKVSHSRHVRSARAISITCDCIPSLERGDQELSNDIKFIKIGPVLRKLFCNTFMSHVVTVESFTGK